MYYKFTTAHIDKQVRGSTRQLISPNNNNNSISYVATLKDSGKGLLYLFLWLQHHNTNKVKYNDITLNHALNSANNIVLLVHLQAYHNGLFTYVKNEQIISIYKRKTGRLLGKTSK